MVKLSQQKQQRKSLCAQGSATSSLLRPVSFLSELCQHLWNTVRGLGSIARLLCLMGKHSLPEARLPLRFCFQYSTVRKLQLMLQPVNSWPLKPSLASPKKPEKHQGTMVNALTRMCLKRISAKSREITTFYYKSHLVILKDYVFLKKKKSALVPYVCTSSPQPWYTLGLHWLDYSIVR